MKMSKRNKGSVKDMIHAFQSKIDQLEGSDIHSSCDVGTKEYRYVTKHGLGPGMMPKDVTLIRSEDLDSYKTAIYIDRPLSKKELDYYDIYPEWIQSGTQMHDKDAGEVNDTYTVEYYLNRACRERRPGTTEDNEDYVIEQFAADSDLDAMQHSIALVEDEEDITISEEYPTEEDCTQHLNGVDWSDGSPFVVKLYTDNKVIWDSGSSKDDFLVYDELEDDLVDMNDEDEVSDGVSFYLSALPIDPEYFEEIVDRYTDIIMDGKYSSVEEWWEEFNDSNDMDQLRSMGYIKEDVEECDHSVNDEYDIVTI